MNNKKNVVILFIFLIAISISLFLPGLKAYDQYSKTDVYYLLQNTFIKIKLETAS